MEKDIDITTDTIKKKWHTMRSQFSRERKLIENSGSGTDQLYTPSLWFYDYIYIMIIRRTSS